MLLIWMVFTMYMVLVADIATSNTHSLFEWWVPMLVDQF